MKPAISVVLFAAGAIATANCMAQESSRALTGIKACAQIRAEGARLDCYDELAAATGNASAPEASATPEQAQPATAPAATAAAPTAASDDFGLSKQATPTREPEQPQEVISRVTELREIQPGRLEITLANGQVWRQTNSDRYPLEPGHEVRIYPTRFGTYFRLSATKLRSFVQVQRVR